MFFAEQKKIDMLCKLFMRFEPIDHMQGGLDHYHYLTSCCLKQLHPTSNIFLTMQVIHQTCNRTAQGVTMHFLRPAQSWVGGGEECLASSFQNGCQFCGLN
jgi:hypothetical protein